MDDEDQVEANHSILIGCAAGVSCTEAQKFAPKIMLHPHHFITINDLPVRWTINDLPVRWSGAIARHEQTPGKQNIEARPGAGDARSGRGGWSCSLLKIK
jgi:hypothetical protein